MNSSLTSPKNVSNSQKLLGFIEIDPNFGIFANEVLKIYLEKVVLKKLTNWFLISAKVHVRGGCCECTVVLDLRTGVVQNAICECNRLPGCVHVMAMVLKSHSYVMEDIKQDLSDGVEFLETGYY